MAGPYYYNTDTTRRLILMGLVVMLTKILERRSDAQLSPCLPTMTNETWSSADDLSFQISSSTKAISTE